jgi:hypothetical protein
MRQLLLVLLAVGNLSAQTSGLTARQLYEPPAPPKGGGAAKGGAAEKRGAKGKAKGEAAVKDPKGKSVAGGDVPDPAGNEVNIVPVALNLGLRYNILRVTDRVTGAAQDVDSESNFRTGDCLQIQFRPNRDSYLYVFNSGSSGAWQPLLPSVQLPDEANHLKNGVVTKVPEMSCLQLKDPKGVDTLLVVLTERQEDVYNLNKAIRDSFQKDDSPRPAPSPGAIGETLAGLQQGARPRADGALVGRDIELQKIGKPEARDEPPNSVYAVNTSTDPNEHVVIQVKIRHE